jgi:hypothetical protein
MKETNRKIQVVMVVVVVVGVVVRVVVGDNNKMNLTKIWQESVNWIYLAQDTGQQWYLVNVIMKF